MNMKKKLVGIIGLVIILVIVAIAGVCIGVWNRENNIKITDVSKYEEILGKEGKFKKNFSYKNVIFPDEIPESAEVEKFYYRYYNPWDPCYLGYLVYSCDEEEYQKEYERLKQIESSKEPYIYGATSFPYELCAVHTDSYYGYVYALADEENQRFIYVELQFCNGFTDIDYEKIIDEKYLPEGFDATQKNP